MKWPDRAFSWVVTGTVAVVVLGLALRLMLIPPYLQLEYYMPYFPADAYGFTMQDRLHWGGLALQYLVNASDIAYLGNLRLANGANLFNARELSHMQDVKHVVQHALQVWHASLALFVILTFTAWRTDRQQALREGARRGGWLILGLALALGSIVITGIAMNPDVFWQFFSAFHGLFFKGDSWQFAYSDSLIRLFPIRFWQDTFLNAALIALAASLGLAVGLRQRGASSHDV